ncbi:MAG: hypothetical protein ABI625_05730 [bacterium]
MSDRAKPDLDAIRRAGGIALSLLIIIVAYDQSQTTHGQASKQMSDDPAKPFALTPEQRSRLAPNINADSLERFLQIAGKNAEERNTLLQLFSQAQGRNQSFHIVGPVSDPTLKALLDEIYAPTWEAWGADAIANSESRLPGRELARAKLVAKKLPPSKDRGKLQ